MRHLAFASTSLLVLCAALRADAQAAPSEPTIAPPAPPSAAATPQPAAPPAPPAAQSGPAPALAPPPPPAASPAPSPLDGAHAKQVLHVLADRDNDARFAGAYSMFISGAATITAGLVADIAYDRYYGRPLWIIGALVEVGGIMSLLRAGTFERLARDADGYTADQLQSEWSRRALLVRQGRKIGGVASLVLGALTIGTGGAIAAGLGDLNREPRQDWTTGLIALGGGIMGSGLVSLLVESPLESSYRAAYGSDPDGKSPLALNVTPTLGGAALNLRASF